MSYQKGDVQVAAECPEPTADPRTGNVFCRHKPTHWIPSYDARADHDDRDDGLKPGDAFLEHSCDEWIIGGEAEIVAMIEDLQAALAALRGAGGAKP